MNGGRRCHGRSPAVGHFAAAAGQLRVAIPLPASVKVERLMFSGHRQRRRLRSEAAVSPRRRHSGRRAGGQGRDARPVPGRARARRWRGLEFTATSGPVPEGGARLGELGAEALLAAVLGALAGGVLLNLMPCVFPILALKALHLSRAAEGPREARADALAYTAGAIAGTGALGVALLAIRAAGSEAGWAFQLQDPRTIILLLLLAVAITANLVGLFELPVLGSNAGRPAASVPARSPPSSRRPALARSSVRHSVQRCCCRWRDRCWCSARSGLDSRCRSWRLPLFQACARSCRSPGAG